MTCASAESATVFYSHPDISYVPIPDLAPDQVHLAVAASRTSPLVDDFLTAAQAEAWRRHWFTGVGLS